MCRRSFSPTLRSLALSLARFSQLSTLSLARHRAFRSCETAPPPPGRWYFGMRALPALNHFHLCRRSRVRSLCRSLTLLSTGLPTSKTLSLSLPLLPSPFPTVCQTSATYTCKRTSQCLSLFLSCTIKPLALHRVTDKREMTKKKLIA